jgi:hypothetical protein
MPQFTTVTKVREIAGFVGNANVSDAQIASYIDMATNQVQAKIGDVYAIPLTRNFENTVVFSGTGTGTSALTIIVNSINYVVTVAVGMTGAQAADAFRAVVLAESSATFKVNGVGGGSTVTMTSCNSDEDLANVTITSTDPQTVDDITATGGTVSEVAPALIEGITGQIAAAYLLLQEYGPESQDTDKDGAKKLAIFDGDVDTPGMLTQIQLKKMKVFDCEGNELATSTTQQISFYPTTASRTDDEDPTANQFTINGKF